MTITTLLIGDFEHPEFAAAHAALCRITQVFAVADVPTALTMMRETDVMPDILIVASHRPGQHAHGALHALRAYAPLTPILGLKGSWCEGESRTGAPWPGMLHVYWHQWLPRVEREAGRFAAGLLPGWGLPSTATAAERVMPLEESASATGGLIAVHSASFDTAEMLCAASRSRGYASLWLAPGKSIHVEGVAAVLWDGIPEQMHDLELLAASFPGTPLLALMDFPRVHDVQRAQQAGAASVTSKPFLLDDIFLQIEAVTRKGKASGPVEFPDARREVA